MIGIELLKYMNREKILNELVNSCFIEWYTLQLMSKTSGFIMQTDEEYQEYIQENTFSGDDRNIGDIVSIKEEWN